MTDECTIIRVTATATDPETGEVVVTGSVTIYDGPCRVQEQGGQGRDAATASDQSQIVHYRTLQLPVSTSDGILAGDQVTITASTNDPDLAGRTFVVRDEAAKSEATARRLGVEEITA